jgi:hypothetical protein
MFPWRPKELKRVEKRRQLLGQDRRGTWKVIEICWVADFEVAGSWVLIES